MLKVITITLFRRPAYTAKLLDALLQCDGVSEYRILLHVEPGYPAVLDLASEFPHPNTELIVNPVVLGCTRNIYESLDHGFGYSDFVIQFEDDIVPASDCLRYFEWAKKRFADDKEVFTVSAYRKAIVGPAHYHSAHRVAWFNCWGWGTWYDRWFEMRDNWGFGMVDSWDIQVNRLRGTRVQIEPLLARSQNIGAEDGTHCPSAAWHRENQFNEFGAWSVPIDRSGQFMLRE